tara:strand:+ start:551 stop:1126 length:576 start_codon:yes stop_codon:yes gene_type:complete
MADPHKKFVRWFNYAKKNFLGDHTAFALGSCDKTNRPYVRMVLLKIILKDGYVFFTNLNSKKGNQFKNNEKLSMCFYWESLKRQIRINGNGSVIPNDMADKYFQTRPRGSQIGALASDQSQVISSRKILMNKIDLLKKKFKNKKINRPNYWTGIKIKPKTFEFWEEGKFRIHKRQFYERKSNYWETKILSP